MQREATPGAMKLPTGAKDREKFQLLEAKVNSLVSRVDALEAIATEPKNKKPKGE